MSYDNCWLVETFMAEFSHLPFGRYFLCDSCTKLVFVLFCCCCCCCRRYCCCCCCCFVFVFGGMVGGGGMAGPASFSYTPRASFSGQFLIKSPVLNLVRNHSCMIDDSWVRSLSYAPHASFSQELLLIIIHKFSIALFPAERAQRTCSHTCT